MNQYRFIYQLTFKNLLLQAKRYFLVATAILGGFAIVVFLSAIASGALSSVKDKAARYFAGHVTITGVVPGGRLYLQNAVPVFESLRESDLLLRTLALRSSYYQGDAELFFSGKTVRQRKLIGVDFSMEGREFTGLRFISGGWKEIAEKENSDGILISKAAAKLLGCRLGDDLTLFLRTDTGQYNSALLVVRGIFDETSLFGYAAYIRSDLMNRLTARPSNGATEIAVYAREDVEIDQLTKDIRRILAPSFPVFPEFATREERDQVIAIGVKQPTLAILSLNSQLLQITQMLDALVAITYFVLAVFVMIVMVGILNTYRMLVHERTKEIGTMRALGMSRGGVRLLVLLESAILALASSLAGFIVAILALWGISALDFSFIPAAGLILESGHIRVSLHPRIVLANLALMIAAAVVAAWGPAAKASHIAPAEAMRSN